MDFFTSPEAVGVATVSAAALAALTLIWTISHEVKRRRTERELSRTAQAATRSKAAVKQTNRLRELKLGVRREIDDFQNRYERGAAPEFHVSSDEIKAQGRSLAAAVERTGADTTRLSTELSVLEGHTFWLEDLQACTRWVERVHGETESDAEWVNSVLNSILDAVKDYVLENDSDHDLLNDDFWIKSATNYFGNARLDTLPIQPNEQTYSAAIHRWVPEKASPAERIRLECLVNYKVLFEHTLIFMLNADFTNGLNNQGREDKFEASVRAVFTTLQANFVETAESEIQSLESQISALTVEVQELNQGSLQISPQK